MTAMITNELRAELSQIAAPALIVHGRDDMLVPVADSIWLAAELRGAQLEIFEDTGHLAMLERPVRFDELLLRFAAAFSPPSAAEPSCQPGRGC
jgi:pimeloyl-ACP methyl ester carboxylesterase